MSGAYKLGHCCRFFKKRDALSVAIRQASWPSRSAILASALMGCLPATQSAFAGTITTSATAPTGANIEISQPDNTVNGGNISGYQDYTDNYDGAGQVFTPLTNFSLTSFTLEGAGNGGNLVTGNWTITIASVKGNYYGGGITILDTEVADDTPIVNDVAGGNASNYDTFTLTTPIALNANKLYYFAISSNAGYYGLAGTPKGANNSSYNQNTPSEEYPGGESANLDLHGASGNSNPAIFQLQDADHTFYVSGTTAVSTASQWAHNGNGTYETPANWSNGVVPQFAGDQATFGSDGGLVTVSPIVTLSTSVTVDSMTFSTPNTPTGGYSIINGGNGQITCNAITALNGVHSIAVPVVTKDGETIVVDPGASLSITSLVDGVGYYHTVSITGGGTLSVNNLNNAAVTLDTNTTLNILAGSAPTTGVYMGTNGGSIWNINSSFTVEQLYANYQAFINISATGALLTEAQTASIDSTVSGTGAIIFGGGANAVSGGNPGNPQITGNNSNYSGPITVTSGASLQLGSQYNQASDAQLGSGIATNTVTLDNGTLTAVSAFSGTHAFIINNGGGTFATSDTVNGTTGVSNFGIGSVSGQGTLTITGGGTVIVAPQVVAVNTSGGIRTLSLGGLNLSTSNISFGSATSHSQRSVVALGALSLSGATGAWTSTLDLGNNDLIVQNGSLATIIDQLHQGYAAGTWQGTGGILSSAAAADSTHLTALGVIPNNGDGSPSIYTTFDGVLVTGSSILVKYTYYGDTNLDGRVDGSDYSLIDNGFNNRLTGWLNGDFNGDGRIDGSDYTLIDNAFLSQGASLATAVATAQIAGVSGTSAVPEPATLGLVGIGALSLLGRRKNRCR